MYAYAPAPKHNQESPLEKCERSVTKRDLVLVIVALYYSSQFAYSKYDLSYERGIWKSRNKQSNQSREPAYWFEEAVHAKLERNAKMQQGRTGWNYLHFLCCIASFCLTKGDAALILRNGNETLVGIDSTRSFNFYIGVQEISPSQRPTATPEEIEETFRRNLTVRYMSIEQDQDAFCHSMRVNGTLFSSFKEAQSQLVIFPWTFDFMCNGDLGTWGTEYFIYNLCKMGSPLLWLVSHNTMFMYQHDGHKFSSWYNGPYSEQIQNCFFAIGLPDTDSELQAMEGLQLSSKDYRVDIEIEWTKYVGFDKGDNYLLVSEGIPGVCFCFLSVICLFRLVVAPSKQDSLKSRRTSILVLNFAVTTFVGVCKLLACIERLPCYMALAILTSFSFTGVGTSILVRSLYGEVLIRLALGVQVRRGYNRQKVIPFVACGISLILDIVFGFLIVNSTTKNAVLIGNLTVLLLSSSQGFVSYRMIKSTRKAKQMLASQRKIFIPLDQTIIVTSHVSSFASCEHNEKTNISSIAPSKVEDDDGVRKVQRFDAIDTMQRKLRKVEGELRIWVAIAAIGAVVSVASYAVWPFFWVGSQYVVLKLFVDVGRFINIWAEINTTAPSSSYRCRSHCFCFKSH